MLSIHVLARPHLMAQVSSLVASNPDWEMGRRTNNLRELLSWSSNARDVLVLDDGILESAPGLLDEVSRIPGLKVTLGRLSDAGAARRALALGAVSLIEETGLDQELPRILAGFEEPEKSPFEPCVIAVYSAKGGVGKSTIALNLAWGLALHSEFPVALVDGDPLGDIGAMIQDKPGASLADVVRGLKSGLSEAKALQSLHTIKGLSLTVVPAASDPRQASQVQAEDLGRVLDALTKTHAYVVLDLATGLTDWNLTAMDRSDQILVLAAPERVTLGSIRRALDILARLYQDKLAVLLNRADSDTGMDVPEVEALLDHRVDQVLPSGGSAPVRAANRGRPLVLMDPKNVLARALLDMSKETVATREGSRRRPRRWILSRGG